MFGLVTVLIITASVLFATSYTNGASNIDIPLNSNTISNNSSVPSSIMAPPKCKSHKKRIIITDTAMTLFAVGWLAFTAILLYRRYTLFPTLTQFLLDAMNPRVDMATASKEALKCALHHHHPDHHHLDHQPNDINCNLIVSESVPFLERQALILGVVGVAVFVVAVPCCAVAGINGGGAVLRRSMVAAVLAVIAEGAFFACILSL